MHFKGKVAIVTGGSSGIGKEAAKRLVAHGASVVLGGRDEAKLYAAAKEVSEDPGAQSSFWRPMRVRGLLVPSCRWMAA
jgi:NAD(P)-dependent dehydrogenase (short-subunit alcohol dehydrogenase family)